MQIMKISTIVVCLALLSGCSPRKMMLSSFTKNLSAESTFLKGEDDPELIKEALPFTIKFFETLLEQNKTNPELHLATGKLFVLNAHIFLMLQTDMMDGSDRNQVTRMRRRAKNHYLRAREHLLNGLEIRHPGIASTIRTGSVDSALIRVTAADTSYLYWTAASWLGAVGADRRDLGLGLSARRAAALLEKTIQLKSDFDNGSAHETYAVFLASAPSSLGGDMERAKAHYQKALQYSEGRFASTFVSGALTFAVKEKDEQQFTALLTKASRINPADDDETVFINTVYRDYARWLLDNKEQFFSD